MAGAAQSRESIEAHVGLAERVRRLANKQHFPKIHYLIEVVESVFLIAAVDISVRCFTWWLEVVETRFPRQSLPIELQSYIQLSVTRVLVTVMDSVAILLSAILGIVTIIRIGREFLRSLDE